LFNIKLIINISKGEVMKRIILALTFFVFAFSTYGYKITGAFDKEEAERQKKAVAAAKAAEEAAKAKEKEKKEEEAKREKEEQKVTRGRRSVNQKNNNSSTGSTGTGTTPTEKEEEEGSEEKTPQELCEEAIPALKNGNGYPFYAYLFNCTNPMHLGCFTKASFWNDNFLKANNTRKKEIVAGIEQVLCPIDCKKEYDKLVEKNQLPSGMNIRCTVSYE
jgi:hypothetical protein